MKSYKKRMYLIENIITKEFMIENRIIKRKLTYAEIIINRIRGYKDEVQ